jgi:hypothetical protein
MKRLFAGSLGIVLGVSVLVLAGCSKGEPEPVKVNKTFAEQMGGKSESQGSGAKKKGGP